MPKLIKMLIFAVALVLAIFAGLLGYILFGVDPNDYKPQLEQLAVDNGIELKIEGDLGWSLFPKLALKIGPTNISGEQHKIRPSSVAGAELSVDWLPLLKKQVVVNALTIDGADIHLDQTQQAAAVLSSPLAGADIGADESGLPFALEFNHFGLTNSKISIHSVGGDITAYDQINLDAQKLNTEGEPFLIKLTLQSKLADKALALSASAELAYHQREKRIEFANLDIEVANLLAELLNISLSGSVDMAQDSLSTKKLQASVGGLVVEGDLQVAAMSTAPAFSGHLAMSSANLKGDLQGITGNAIATGNPDALKLFEMQLDYSGNADQWTMANLQLTLDSTHITGYGTLTTDDYRELQLSLVGDQLNLDSYRAAKATADTPAQEEVPAEGTVDGDKALLAPLAALIALLDGGAGNIQLAFATLVTAETTFDKAKATIKLDGDKVSLAPVELGLYGGRLDTTIDLDLANSPTQISFNLTASDLDIAQAQEQWAKNANLQGRLAMTIKGTSRGDTAEQIHNALAGEGNLSIDNLHLASINLEQNYCELAQLVEKNPPREELWPQGTDLHKFDSQFALQGQTIVLKDYKTGLGNLKIRGDGTIRLDQEKFAIKVITRLEGDRTSETGCIVKSRKVRDRDIPLLCKDKFAKAGKSSCQPDPDFVRELLQKELLDKFIKPDKDGKEKPLESLLKGLFGG